MYACILARAWTGRDLVVKAGGGWHGAQPWGLKGVAYDAHGDNGFQRVDSEGLSDAIADEVIVTRYNDPEMLRDRFRQYGDRIACFMVEPFIGAGGFIPATREFLRTARELTQASGAVLISDEVISGFRFRAGDLATFYGVQPDLFTFGKIIGGGMPMAAVAGRAAIMDLVGRARGGKVKFSGGTYSGHPAAMLAAKTILTYLSEHEDQVYPFLADMGEKTRRTIEAAFISEGIYARCTGDGGDVLPGSSMVFLHFPYEEDATLDTPEGVFSPSTCDVTLSRKVVELALLLENVYLQAAHGAVTTTHTEEDLTILAEACHGVARRIKAHLG
jgi:glutamate-1-semialdehyde 2,1-aminomutase